MGVSAFGEGTIELSEFDDIFHSYITGGAVDSSTVSGWRAVGGNINKVTSPAGFLVVSAKAQVVNDTTGAVSDKWSHWIYPNVQVRPAYPNASQNAGVNPNSLSYTFVPSRATRGLDGLLFSATSLSMEEDSDLMYHLETDNPIAVTTYVEAATPDGSFTLAYKPLTTESDTTDKKITANGAAATITSINTTTGAVVCSTATAGQRFVAVYETAYIAP